MHSSSQVHKYIIIGAGPGGLQMGYFLEKQGLDYVILEKNDTAGSFFKHQPVHRKLISINKKYNFFEEPEFNWRHDWNSLLSDVPALRMTEYTEELFPNADLIYQYFQDYAAHFQLNIQYGTTVSHITKNADGQFVVETTGGAVYQSEVLLLGLGAIESMVPKEVEGIELATPYEDQSLDLEQYKNKRVCILGQGNSAFETADYLSGVAAYVHIFAKHPVKHAWDTHFVGDLRAVNNSIFDMYQLKAMHAVLNPRLKKIEKLPNGTLQTHHEYDYPNSKVPGTLKLTREYDIIIRATGWKWMNDSLFDPAVLPATWKEGKYPELTSNWESTNVPDCYFIGASMQGNDRQAASGFIHGFRYTVRSLAKLLAEKYDAKAYPVTTFDPLNWEDLLSWMYERFSLSAALFQLYGVLCDSAVFSADKSKVEIREELPLAYAQAQPWEEQHVLLFTLEFGFKQFSEPSLTFMGPSDPQDTSCAAFLHPVIRHRFKGKETVFHFGDSLLARWDRPHGEGGAVMSYHYAFLQWLETQLGVDLQLPEPVEGGPYHKWTEAEKALWEKNQATESMMYPCIRPV